MKTNDCEHGEEIDCQAVYDEMCSHSFLFPVRRQDSPKPGPDIALGRMTDSKGLTNDETNVKMTACAGLVAVYSNSVLFRERHRREYVVGDDLAVGRMVEGMRSNVDGTNCRSWHLENDRHRAAA